MLLAAALVRFLLLLERFGLSLVAVAQNVLRRPTARRELSHFRPVVLDGLFDLAQCPRLFGQRITLLAEQLPHLVQPSGCQRIVGLHAIDFASPAGKSILPPLVVGSHRRDIHDLLVHDFHLLDAVS
jgi:hypothetical protein